MAFAACFWRDGSRAERRFDEWIVFAKGHCNGIPYVGFLLRMGSALSLSGNVCGSVSDRLSRKDLTPSNSIARLPHESRDSSSRIHCELE
jgi:hypothetical protein